MGNSVSAAYEKSGRSSKIIISKIKAAGLVNMPGKTTCQLYMHVDDSVSEVHDVMQSECTDCLFLSMALAMHADVNMQ